MSCGVFARLLHTSLRTLENWEPERLAYLPLGALKNLRYLPRPIFQGVACGESTKNVLSNANRFVRYEYCNDVDKSYF